MKFVCIFITYLNFISNKYNLKVFLSPNYPFDKLLLPLYTLNIMKLEYKVTKPQKYTNIRQVLMNEFNLSARLILKLKRANQIYLNTNSTHIHHPLNINDIVSVDIAFEEDCENIVPTKMDLDILYEDDCLLIVNKVPNMPVHPSLNHYEDSLSNGVKYYFTSQGLKRKIRPINRLDKDTSGIVLFAKNEYIQECLIKQMKTNIFEKEYLALVSGILTTNKQTVIAPIARKETSIIERCVKEDGDYAETDIELINIYENYSLIQCKLKTGRTHQIRVHTLHIGHPILGDTLYGSASSLINRQALHAHKVKFIHPITKKNIEITCTIPKDMLTLGTKY